MRFRTKVLIYCTIITILNQFGFTINAQLTNEQLQLIQQYTQLIRENKAKGMIKEAASYSNKKAFIYVGAGKYEEAITSYIESAELNNQIANDTDNKKIFNNIAMLYAEMSQMDNSIRYFEKSLIISRRNNNKNEIAISLMDISTILIYNKQYPKAIEYLQEALKIANDQDNLNSLISCYDLLSKSYRESGNEKLANEYNKKYLALDQLRKEGKSYSNKSDAFLSAESENLNRNKPETIENKKNLSSEEHLSVSDKNTGISESSEKKENQANKKDSPVNSLNSVEQMTPEGDKLENASEKSENNQLINTLTFLVAIMAVLIAFGVYVLIKKQKEITQLKTKLSEYKNLHEK